MKSENLGYKTDIMTPENHASFDTYLELTQRSVNTSLPLLLFARSFSRLTFYVSRFAFHVSRFTFYISRFTFYISRFTFYVLLTIPLDT